MDFYIDPDLFVSLACLAKESAEDISPESAPCSQNIEGHQNEVEG